jgi:DNA modification methylase
LIIHGDCREELKAFEDGYFDAIVTDPPYGIDYQCQHRKDKTLWHDKILNDEKPFIDWLDEAFRVLKDGGAMHMFYRWDVQDEFLSAVIKAGFTPRSQIVWDKVIHGMGDLQASYGPQHELVLFCTKGNFTFPNARPRSVIRQTRVNAEKMIHPNQKPVPLMIKLITDITKPGDLVL